MSVGTLRLKMPDKEKRRYGDCDARRKKWTAEEKVEKRGSVVL